jgi:hypothetical protein
MGHHITALIGDRQDLQNFTDRFGSPPPTEIPCNLVIVPLDENRLDALATSFEAPLYDFTYLTPAISREITRALGNRPALYIETNYFGGMGRQAAALFKNGELAWKKASSTFASSDSRPFLERMFKLKASPPKSPVSEGLAKLGVPPSRLGDEFDHVGLGRFRSLEHLGFYEED